MRFLAAWLGLHALLLQLVLPIFHHPAYLFASRGALAEALHAFADMGALPVAHQSDRNGDHKQAPPCPLCLSIQHAQAFLPPTSPALLLPAERYEAILVAPSRERRTRIDSAARARGPPRLA